MTLTVLDLKPEYRSSRASLLEAFFRPCLKRSVRYDRAVGFFASSSLALLADGLDEFLDNGGAIRLVASPKLDAEDAKAMELGYAQRRERVEEAIQRELARLESDPDFRSRLDLLAWLIAHERLDIKLAIVGTDADFGMYHEKLGIFVDEDNNVVAFAGSANESYGGLVGNFESVDVFCSWLTADLTRADAKRQAFEHLWRAETPNVEIYDFPDAARERLIEIAPRERPRGTPDAGAAGSGSSAELRRPAGFVPRDYQADAVRRWIGNGGRGVFAMATGTGKTLTCLTAASVVAQKADEQGKPLVVVVVCPQKHLVTQWSKDVRAFGVEPLLCFESSAHWTPEANRQRLALNDGRAAVAVWITTNATFASNGFQTQLDSMETSLMLVADEMHNLGATRLRKMLPERATFRLGLSATPERRNDEEGTGALLDYFGEVVFALPLHEAIKRKILTPYRYFPTVVELADDELEEYIDLSEKIARAIGGGSVNFADLPPAVENLLFKRARLIGGARGKLSRLGAAIEEQHESHTLVYCSDSAVNGTSKRQIDAVTELLGAELQLKVAQYTHETSTQLRAERLQLFDEGRLDALIAINCLDEGVDVPATRRAFILASSTNPRQYVQRRGRVLRRHEGKQRAEIHDFVVVPPEGAVPPALLAIERRLVNRELARVVEFAEHAENGPVAMNILLPVQERYGLLHV